MHGPGRLQVDKAVVRLTIVAVAVLTLVVATVTSAAGASAEPVPNTVALWGVACETSSSCFAVGSGENVGVLVPITDGSPGAAVPIAQTYWLNDIACPSATTCYAVGWDSTNNNSVHGVLVTLTNGKATSVAATPGVELDDYLACSSVASCTAIGQTAKGAAVLLPITNGVPGTARALTGVTSLGTAEGGIVCPSTSSCLVVAGTKSSQVVVPVNNGTPGTVEHVPGSGSDSLRAIACYTATACVAVGSGYDDNSPEVPTVPVLVPITNGTPGSAYKVDSHPNDALLGVSCYSSSLCVAVGGSGGGPLLMRIVDGQWRNAVELTSDGQQTLSADACPPGPSCVGAGENAGETLQGAVISFTKSSA